ncbi:MAG: hypothetical protein D6732_00145 [Methanobacteriota archaeon]|nr:MAG: hypothetical protein D6732_00145 [Euryarchaeota archaeon]
MRFVLKLAILVGLLSSIVACGGGGNSSSGSSSSGSGGDTTDVIGYWMFYHKENGSSVERGDYLYIENDTSGNWYCDSTPVTVSLSGNNITLSWTDEGISITTTGIVSGNEMSGSFDVESRGISVTWRAVKISAAPFETDCVMATVDTFLVRFQDDNYCIESKFDDPNGIVSSATLEGMGNTQNYVYNPFSGQQGEWWDDGARYCTTSPAFPMDFKTTIDFVDGITRQKTITVEDWEWAQ